LPEAAIRFAIAHPAMGTILVGMASVDEFETALAAVLKGPLPAAALQRVAELTAGFSGEGTAELGCQARQHRRGQALAVRLSSVQVRLSGSQQ
jgi:predicted aldo/keto reductase-like oxidoreductase